MKFPSQFILWFLALAAMAAVVDARSFRGVPYTRQYSFDDIGGVSSGAELSVDAAGRIGLAQDGKYIVLNDESWLVAVDREEAGALVQHVKTDAQGQTFYCSAGSWGRLERAEGDLLKPVPLMPAQRPHWTTAANFDQIVPCPEGVVFASTLGVVFWQRDTGRTIFAELEGLLDIFYHSGDVHVSGFGIRTRKLDLDTGELVAPSSAAIANIIVAHSARLGPETTIVADDGDALLLYAHGRVSRLAFPDGPSLGGHISTLAPLADGNFAAGVVGRGIYVLSPGGDIVLRLAGSDFPHATSFVSNEPGVLWAVTERSVSKVLYGAPVTRVGQGLGLPIGWPQLVAWKDRLVVASDGKIYESIASEPGEPTRFRAFGVGPSSEGWGLAAAGEWLFVGNRYGIFAKTDEGAFRHVLEDMDVARLECLETGELIAIGTNEIAALRWDGTEWRECAPRAAGVGYPATTHTASSSVWIELGANLAARISLESDAITVRRFDAFPWEDPRWIHISILGDTVILGGPEGGRMYFDERTKDFAERPEMDALLARAEGFWPARVLQDEAGVYWMSHAHGVSLLDPARPGAEIDDRHRIINEHIPLLHPLPDGVVALSTGRSLYFLEQAATGLDYARFKPLVVSATDARTGADLLADGGFAYGARLPFAKNSITLRLFAGSYGLRRLPEYEYRVNQSNWTRLDGSLLSLSNLPEGDYRLEARLIDPRGTLGEPLGLAFSVAPPWTRTVPARIALALAVGAALLIGAQLLMRRAKRRHDELESVVAERTEQLADTLEKLEQETRTSATLAERNRLAGEIHDTLEQGFSALILQLDTTSRLNGCPADVQAGLTIARNMVAFSRDEVRDAVWGLHSPRLNSGNLADAIERLLYQTAPRSIKAEMEVVGQPRTLPSKVEHHLLRIAQEAVANAVKHGAPQRIDACLAYAEGEVALTISDDGTGFNPDSLASVSHGRFGLQYLKTRSSKIGARLELSSAIGSGTRITVVAPIPAR